MEAGSAISFPGGVGRIVSGATLQESVAWREAFAGKAKDHRFYEIVEETLESGFEHHYLVLEDDAGVIRGIQPLFFVQQNIVEGVPAIRAAVDLIRRRFPRFLTMRMLMAGCAAGEGHLGAGRAEDETWMVTALQATLQSYARAGNASLVVFKDFSAAYREAMKSLVTNGYARVPSMPMTQLQLRFRDFEEYLNSLSKATRKDLRRKYRKIAKTTPIVFEAVTDISPLRGRNLSALFTGP